VLRVSIPVGTAIGVTPSVARAESRLEYRVPSDCPTQADFVKAVAARGGNLDRLAYDGNVMEVWVRKEDQGYAGSFQARSSGAPSAAREVHGATCSEVVDALAVVVAIMLRPGEEETPSVLSAGDGEPEPAKARARAAQSRRVPAPTRSSPEPERPLKTTMANTFPAPFVGGDKEVEVEAGKLRFESIVSATAFGGVAVGVIPGLVMPRVEASLWRANFVTPPGTTSYMVGPLWRFRLSLLGDVKYRSGDLTTEAGGQAVGLSLCYSPYFDAGGLGILGCFEVGAEAMFLRTTDASGATVQSKRLGTGTVGFGIEMPYNIGRHFQLALKLGADVATSPFTAERADGSRIFESSWLSGYAAIGLGGHW
jgi:hypothetical protein